MEHKVHTYFNKPLFKVIIRSKILLINTICIFLFLFVFKYAYDLAEDKYIAHYVSFLFAAVIPRCYFLQKMLCSCSDLLITIKKDYFGNLVSDFYNFIAIIAIISAFAILLITKNLYLSINFVFLLLGIMMIVYTICNLFDAGRINILSLKWYYDRASYNITSTLLLIVALSVIAIVYYFALTYLTDVFFTLINALQFLTVFLTRKFWFKIANDIYMKDRYNNLSKCRGE